MILAFTLASAFSVNPYQYGVHDTLITIPFTKAAAHPELYPGDYLLEQRPYYYTYLWETLGHLHVYLGIPLPALFFTVYLAALYFTFFGVYSIAMTLFARREVALLSLVFLLFSKPTLAGINTLDGFLTTRLVATPLLLFGIHDFLTTKTVRAFLMLGLAYLIHPLTTHNVLPMMVVMGLVHCRGAELTRFRMGLLGFLAVASPLLVWKFASSPESMHLISVDPRWIETLRLRSPHHMFPLSWDSERWLAALLVLLLFSIGWIRRDTGEPQRHRVMLGFGAVIVGYCLLGVIFSEVFPVALTFQLQPPRAFQFMEYFAMIYTANYLYRAAHAERSRELLLAIPLALGMFVGTYYWVRGLTLFLPVAAFLVARRFGRHFSEPAFITVVLTLVCVQSAAYGARAILRHDRWTVSIADAQEPEWLEVQDWAREFTDVHDTFIVPPVGHGEFRVESERTVYADWRDGGLMNSNPAFGLEWLRRMRRLGLKDEATFEDFTQLGDGDVFQIARELRVQDYRVFLVMPGPPTMDRDFPIRYRNSRYVVYEVGAKRERQSATRSQARTRTRRL